MIAGIEDDVFDRFARLQDRTDKPLQLTASGPAPDRSTLAQLRDRGAHRALVWLPQDTGGAVSVDDTERFLDDLVANTAHLQLKACGSRTAFGKGSLSVAPSSGAPTWVWRVVR